MLIKGKDPKRRSIAADCTSFEGGKGLVSNEVDDLPPIKLHTAFRWEANYLWLPIRTVRLHNYGQSLRRLE